MRYKENRFAGYNKDGSEDLRFNRSKKVNNIAKNLLGNN